MSQPCEFEEDTFQQAIDIEIGKITNYFTTPGRVSENVLGYDAAFYINPNLNFDLLRRLAFRRKRRLQNAGGIHISGTHWNRLSKLLKKPPKFKVNLFLQYKVPEKLIGHKAAQWAHWGGEYFRYSLRTEQLDILCQVEQRAGTSAIVCYGSPAFLETDALVQHSIDGAVIQNTNFVPAGKLKGHHVYTYSSALGMGLAHSEVEEVTPLHLGEIIEARLSSSVGEDFASALKKCATVIREAAKDYPKTSFLQAVDLPEGLAQDFATIRRFEIFAATRVYLLG